MLLLLSATNINTWQVISWWSFCLMSAIVPFVRGAAAAVPLAVRAGDMVRNVRKRRRPGRPARGVKRPLAKRPRYSRRYKSAAMLARKRKAKKKFPSDVAGKNISSTNIGRPLPWYWKAAAKSVNKCWHMYNGATSWTSDIGKQNIFMVSCNNAYAQDLSVAELATQQNVEDADLLNLQRKVGDYVNTANQAGRLARVLLRKSQINMLITNQTDGYCMLTLYDIVCKRDCDDSATNFIDQGLRNQINAVAFPSNQATPANVTVANMGDMLKMEPSNSILFNQYYTILKRRSILMNPGMVFSHTFTNAVNKVFDGSLFQNNLQYKRGWWFGTLLKIHGMPANDSTGAVTSLGSSKIAMVYTKKFKYQWLYNNVPLMTGFQNLASAVPLQNMNEDGDIEAMANA